MDCVLTVSQITTYLKSVIDGDDNLKNIYVSGEISNFTNHYRTGHFYFTLKDQNSSIKAVMFRTSAQRIRFVPENGMKVLIRGRISVYEADGITQLYCEDMMPDGVGELTIAFEQLKKRLASMGMFDVERKKTIPEYPERIGVITSPTGAALQDILSVLARRYPSGEIIFSGVQVQGDSAAAQIAQAIRAFNELKAADVLIVGRGGGSIEDLWAFNEEIVAQAIFESDIPVISAVGHETDFTISDYVSDLRAPTPSAAAELVAPDYRELLYSLDKTLDIMTDSLMKRINSYKLMVMESSEVISSFSPEKTVMLYQQLVNACEDKINRLVSDKLQNYGHLLSAYSSRLEATSPLKVIARGYAYVKDDFGFTVKSVDGLKENDKISVVMSDGQVECTVSQIIHDSDL